MQLCYLLIKINCEWTCVTQRAPYKWDSPFEKIINPDRSGHERET